MKSGTYFRFVEIMKRFLFSGALALIVPGLAGAASSTFFWPSAGYNGSWPPVIDATNFVNTGIFNVAVPAQAISGDAFDLFQTSDTLNYTNSGFMSGTPGFDLEFYPTYYIPPQPGVPFNKMAANFVNRPNGVNGGVITCSGFTTNSTIFGFGVESAKFLVNATNIINSGTIALDNSAIFNILFIGVNGNIIGTSQNTVNALLSLNGESIDLSGGTLSFTSSGSFSNALFGISSRDYGVGTDTNGDWNPGLELTAGTALSSFFQTVNGTAFFLDLFSSTAYSYAVPVGTNTVITRAVYLQDLSGPNVTKNVYFGGSIVGSGAAHVEWAAPYLDPMTHAIVTNYLYLSDLFVDVTTNTPVINGVPINYSFAESTTPLLTGPASPNTPTFNPGVVTNLYAYLDAQLIPTLTTTNSIFGGSVTNLPERIQITASRTLNLSGTTINGPDYLSLTSTNQYEGNNGAAISAPFSDINLGVTNGFLTISNLLPPLIPRWSGQIQAFTGRWFDVDTNTGATNDNRVLLVNSQVFPTTTPKIQDLTLHATNTLTISDSLNVTRNLFIDATSLVITTNDFTALSGAGGLNILNPNITWSASSMPNLRYLTNYGTITALNTMNFAGNMFTPYSDPDAATPYAVFINHGMVTNQGSFIVANLFVNDGVFENNPGGDFTLRSQCVTLTNGLISAPAGAGDISIAANSLVVSNHALLASGTISLSITNCITDGYWLFNQFGHSFPTNAPVNGGVTNGNFWTAGGNLNMPVKPDAGDLLATTISNSAVNSGIIVWAGNDIGQTPAGFVNNLALGHLIMDGQTNAHFSFVGAGANNALYVDSIDFQSAAWNSGFTGTNFPNITIAPNMRVYYAQATAGGIPISEKLNGANGGRFLWVSNYAGIFSATNVLISGSWYTFNTHLVQHVAAYDPTLTSLLSLGTFDNTVAITPCECEADTGSSSSGGSGSIASLGGKLESASSDDNILAFPVAPTVAATSNVFILTQGDYNGLFYETNGVVPGHAGSISANLNNKGRLSGSLKLGASSYNLSGNLNSSGAMSLTNLKSGKNLVQLNVGLQVDLGGGGQMTGYVSDVGSNWVAMLLADRATNMSKGRFTFVIPGNDAGGTNSPAGHGFGTLSIIGKGLVQWSATLADGTVIPPQTSARRTISGQGIYPLYYAPYGGAGLLMGWLQFTNANDSDFGGEVIWIKPGGVPGSYYNAGFTNDTGVVGSAYAQPAVNSTNSMLVLGGGNLSALVTNLFALKNNFQAKGSNQFNFMISKPTGVFSGSAVGDGHANPFKGVILQKAGAGFGYFLGTNESGQVWFNPMP